MKKSTALQDRALIEVRHSAIHGFGVFARRQIRKGTTVTEYIGERVSHAVADQRHETKDPNDNHTFLFTVDRRTVIDGGVDGNDARYINHSCEPNCESTTANRRVFIEALRTIRPGEELAYDYMIQRDDDDEPDVDLVFACRCGAKNCRGSMLEPKKAPKRAAAKVKRPARKSNAKTAARKKSSRQSAAGRPATRQKAPAKRARRSSN